METIVIQLIHEKAFRLIEELEELKIIKVVKKDNSIKEGLSNKFRGKLSKQTAKLLQQHISDSRESWT